MRAVILEKDRQEAVERADAVLQQHTLRAISEGMYDFTKPGSAFYSCRLIAAAGIIVLYGDIGELILRPGTKDPIAWLQKIFTYENYDMGYIVSKIPTDFKVGEFSSTLLREWVLSLDDGDRKKVLPHTGTIHSYEELYHLLEEEGMEFPSDTCLQQVRWHTMFQIECLRRIVQAIGKL